MITKNKVLIIKLGYSETLDPVISKECSFGDVVRSTVILNYFRGGDNITWLCDEKAEALLMGNPRINRVLTWDFNTAIQLLRERFDLVVNLEKSPAICAIADTINTWRRCGFRLNDWLGRAEAHYNTEKVLEICRDSGLKEENTKYWQEHLAAIIDKKWNPRDKYIMKKPQGASHDEIALNWMVGDKWPKKAWPKANWEALASALQDSGLTCAMQSPLWLPDYMVWINAHRVVVSCDSLGMHLALAYGRRVVPLFGPTSSTEVYFYDLGKPIVGAGGRMENISVDTVLEAVLREYKVGCPESSSV